MLTFNADVHSFALKAIFISMLSFFCLHLIVFKIISIIPIYKNHTNKWRLKNTIISWLHAVTCSILIIKSILNEPRLLEDMISVRTDDAYMAICVSIGYFLYDTQDILRSNKKLTSANYEVLTHHFLIFFIFSIPLYANKFIGYTVVAFLMEINTVFLHIRFFFVFNGVNKAYLSYKIASIINIVTFVIFRLITVCWMIRWIVLNRIALNSTILFSIGSFGLAAILLINMFLLQRLVQADFQKTSTTSSSSSLPENGAMCQSNGAKVPGNGTNDTINKNK